MEMSLKQNYIPRIISIRRERVNSDGQPTPVPSNINKTNNNLAPQKDPKKSLSPVKLLEVNRNHAFRTDSFVEYPMGVNKLLKF